MEVMEQKVEGYVKTVFTLNWRTEEALNILACFQSVLNRPALSVHFQEKYSLVLGQFEEDLEYVEKRYTTKK